MTVMSFVIGAYMVRSAGVGDVPNQPSAEGVTVVLFYFLVWLFRSVSKEKRSLFAVLIQSLHRSWPVRFFTSLSLFVVDHQFTKYIVNFLSFFHFPFSAPNFRFDFESQIC